MDDDTCSAALSVHYRIDACVAAFRHLVDCLHWSHTDAAGIEGFENALEQMLREDELLQDTLRRLREHQQQQHAIECIQEKLKHVESHISNFGKCLSNTYNSMQEVMNAPETSWPERPIDVMDTLLHAERLASMLYKAPAPNEAQIAASLLRQQMTIEELQNLVELHRRSHIDEAARQMTTPKQTPTQAAVPTFQDLDKFRLNTIVPGASTSQETPSSFHHRAHNELRAVQDHVQHTDELLLDFYDEDDDYGNDA